MNILSLNYWNKFEKDGRLFEDLVQELLNLKYDGLKWERTQISWDGKRDFYAIKSLKELKRDKIWAECKYYKEKVSINVLAPTLVVAFVENTNVILFFSYSEINENAKKYLQKFRESSRMEILIYDDVKLEELILQYKDKINFSKYFPDVNPENLIYNQRKDLNYSYTVLRDVHHDYSYDNYSSNVAHEALSSKSIPQFRLYENLAIDLFLENQDINHSKTLKITLKPEEIEGNLELLDYNLTQNKYCIYITLPPNGIYFYRFKFRIIHYSKTIKLPNIYMGTKTLDTHKIKCTWLADAPLIGSDYHKIKEKIRAESMCRNALVCFNIFGMSGTGKSRILKEIQNIFLSLNFDIFTFNGENARSTARDLVRCIVSKAMKMPLFPLKPMDLASFHSVSSDESERGFAAKILYDNSFDFAKHTQQCAEFLFSLLSRSHNAVIIDNLQFYDELTAEIINTVITISNNSIESRLIFILSFNKDYLFSGTTTNILYNRLKELEIHIPSRYFNFEVKGFTRGQATEFVTHCLSGKIKTSQSCGLKYEKSIELLINKTGTLPLFLEQALLFLEQEKALIKSDDSFYIHNIEHFHSLLEKIPPQLKELINRRWETLLKAYGSDKKTSFEEVVKILVFMKQLPYHLVENLFMDIDALEILMESGIITRTANNLVFQHGLLEKFFNEKFSLRLKTVYEKILDFIDEFELQILFPTQYFIASKKSNKLTDETISFAVDCLLEDLVNREFKVEFAVALYEVVNRWKINISKNILIKVFDKLCYDLKTYGSFEEALNYYKEIYDKKLRRIDDYRAFGDLYFEFIKEYANTLILLHLNLEAQCILLEAKMNLQHFSFTSQYEKKSALGIVLNRLCVVYKSLNDKVNAVATIEESLKIAVDIGNIDLEIRNCFDYGYIYYKNREQNAELARWWNHAYEVFKNRYDPKIEKRRGGVLFHKAIINLIYHEYEEALEHIDEAVKFFEIAPSPYYEIKLTLLKALVLMICRESPDVIEKLINKAEDLCVIYRSVRTYYNCFYMKAKLYMDMRNILYSKVLENYCIALEQLELFIHDEKMEERYQYFFEDMAINLKRINKSLPDDRLALVKSKKLIGIINNILHMEDEEFQNFIRNYRATTSITNENETDNFPCP